jgi:hypothetical protein
MTDATLRQAAEVQKMFMDGAVSHAVAQQRLRFSGYRLNDRALLDELARQEQAVRAEAEAAEARRRRQDQRVSRYLHEQYEQVRGIDINGL